MSSFLSFLICKMGLESLLHSQDSGKATTNPPPRPTGERAPGEIGAGSEFFLSSQHSRELVFSSGAGRGMVGQDQVFLAQTPGPPGSSKFGNLGSRQTYSNIIAVMSDGSRSADAPRLQRGGSCRPCGRAPFPHPAPRRVGGGGRPGTPRLAPASARLHPPSCRSGSGFPSTPASPRFPIFCFFSSSSFFPHFLFLNSLSQ